MRVQLANVKIGSTVTLVYPSGSLAEGSALPKGAPRARLVERRADGTYVLESLNGLRLGKVHVAAGKKLSIPGEFIEKVEFHTESPTAPPVVESRPNELARIARRITGRKDNLTESTAVATVSQEEADRQYEAMKQRTAGVADDPALKNLDEAQRKEQIDADSAYMRLKSNMSGGATAAAAHGG